MIPWYPGPITSPHWDLVTYYPIWGKKKEMPIKIKINNNNDHWNRSFRDPNIINPTFKLHGAGQNIISSLQDLCFSLNRSTGNIVWFYKCMLQNTYRSRNFKRIVIVRFYNELFQLPLVLLTEAHSSLALLHALAEDYSRTCHGSPHLNSQAYLTSCAINPLCPAPMQQMNKCYTSSTGP